MIRVSGGVEIFSAGSHLAFIIIRYEHHHHHHKFKPHTSGQVWELIRNCVAIIYMLIARLAKLATLIYSPRVCCGFSTGFGRKEGSGTRDEAGTGTLKDITYLCTYVL